jgi:metallo-beta-lactamase family protein
MSLTLTLHGASGGVTGSCFALETETGTVLVDCGLFQGSKSEKELNYRPFPFEPREIAACLLTHAHIDHAGLIPKLVKAGFRSAVHATAATVDLASVMLPDSGYIQETEVAFLNRRNARRGRKSVEPIYTAHDANVSLDRFVAHPYATWFDVIPGTRARFWNAGHLLGDLGPDERLLHPDPDAPRDFDVVVCESTYGDTDRIDSSPAARRKLLCDEIRAAENPNGVVLIPSFAVERTQELLVDLVGAMRAGDLPSIPIFIDSPLASRATTVFAAHARELENGGDLIAALRAPQIRFTESVAESKALDQQTGFHIVLAASGMCEAGRIRHRLENWLWREEATVLFVGFQAQGTLGRILRDGAQRVRIRGEEIDVRARIRAIDLYSGHADGPELAAWTRERGEITRGVFLVHGEDDARQGLAQRLNWLDPDKIVLSRLDERYDLTGPRPRLVETRHPPRLSPERTGRLDWHNDLSRLILDIGDAVDGAADERARAVVIRRLRRALDGG